MYKRFWDVRTDRLSCCWSAVEQSVSVYQERGRRVQRCCQSVRLWWRRDRQDERTSSRRLQVRLHHLPLICSLCVMFAVFSTIWGIICQELLYFMFLATLAAQLNQSVCWSNSLVQTDKYKLSDGEQCFPRGFVLLTLISAHLKTKVNWTELKSGSHIHVVITLILWLYI